jgi:hypothetical protein
MLLSCSISEAIALGAAGIVNVHLIDAAAGVELPLMLNLLFLFPLLGVLLMIV